MSKKTVEILCCVNKPERERERERERGSERGRRE